MKPVHFLTSLLILSTIRNSEEFIYDQNRASEISLKRARRDADDGAREALKKLLANYDSTKTPGEAGHGESTMVKAGIYINSIKFSGMFEFSASIYFRQSWVDHRLRLPPGADEKVKLRVMGENIDKIWKPDTFFTNADEIKDYQVPARQALLRIDKDGKVWYVQKLNIKASCKLNASRYPMDKKICSLVMESFGYTADSMDLGFLPSSLDTGGDSLDYAGWDMKKQETTSCHQNYTTDTYPCLRFDIKFSRNIRYLVLKVYVPSILLVILSWLPLFMGSEQQIIARLVPGVAALLGLIFLQSSAYDGIPEVPYVTPMHIWMGFSHLIVFLSIVKILFLDKIFEGKNQTRFGSDGEKIIPEKGEGGRFKSIVDGYPLLRLLSSCAFPALYVIFCAIYWIVLSV